MPLFNILGGILSGLGGMASSNRAAGEQERASRMGFDFLQGSPVGEEFVPRGGQASELRAGLLGLGGDEDASNEAFDRFLQNSGFQKQLQTGREAITGSRAASGILNSGRTGAALQEFGSDLGQRGFQDFLGQLGGVAGQGLQAAGQIGSAGSQAGAGVANAASTRQGGFGDLARGLGSAAQFAFGGG